jgi:general secretion pathway protein C
MGFAYLAVYWVLMGLGEFDVPEVAAVALAPELGLERASTEQIQEALGLSKADAVQKAVNPNALLSARIRLTGIVFEGTQGAHGAHSIAILSVDQKAAKPYRVGSSLEPGLMVLSITPKQVNLGPELHSQPTLSLELAPSNTP